MISSILEDLQLRKPNLKQVVALNLISILTRPNNNNQPHFLLISMLLSRLKAHLLLILEDNKNNNNSYNQHQLLTL
jgi:hypothetical protein